MKDKKKIAKSSKKKRKIAIMLIFLTLIQILSQSNYSKADTIQDEDDLEMQIVSQFETNSSEIAGAGRTMGLGLYEVGSPETWYEAPEMDKGTSEFDYMRTDFSNMHRLYSDSIKDANFTETKFLGNCTHKSTWLNNYGVGAGNITTIKMLAKYNYSYNPENVSSYQTLDGSDNSAPLEDLQKCDSNYLQITSTNSAPKSINGFTTTYGSHTGNIATYNTNTASKDALNYDIASTSYPNEVEESFRYYSRTKFDGDSTSYDENENDWSEDNDGDYLEFEGKEHDELSFDISAVVWVRSDVIDIDPYDQKYKGTDIDIRFDVDIRDDYIVNIESRCRIYLGRDGDDWDDRSLLYDTGDMSGDSPMSETSISESVSDLDDYLTYGRLYIGFLITAEADWVGVSGTTPDLEVEVEVEEIDVERLGCERIDVVLDYPAPVYSLQSSGYYAYYKIYCPSTGTYVNSRYIQIADEIQQLTTGWNDFYKETSGLAQDLRLIYIGVSSFTFSIDYMRVYDINDKFEVESKLNFDHTNRSSINRTYFCKLNYYVNSPIEFFKLQYSNDATWTDVSSVQLTSTTPETIKFKVQCYDPQFRIIENGDFYTRNYESYDNFDIYIDEFNLTSTYEPFLNIWVNFSYIKSALLYNEKILMGFDEYRWFNGTHGNVTYVFTSYDFKHYDTTTPFEIPKQQMNFTFLIAFKMNISVNFTIEYSSIDWCESSEENFQLNGEDVFPKSPSTAYIECFSFPDSLEFTADHDLMFKMTTDIQITFYMDLYISSRRILKQQFTLVSDHSILITEIIFDEDIQASSVWLEGIEYSVSNNRITPNRDMNTNEEFEIIIYLGDDIYKELQHFTNYLGSGSFKLYLSGTSNTYFYDDYTKDNNWRISLPVGYELDEMDLKFSQMRYLPSYTTNNSHNTFDYYYKPFNYVSENVSFSQDNYNTNVNAYRVAESGNSGFENVDFEDFSTETAEMSHNYYPDGYNSSYSASGDIFMENMFPQEFHDDSFSSWNLDYDSEFSSSAFHPSPEFSVLTDSDDVGALGGNDDPAGLVYANGNYYVTDNTDAYVYKYSADLSSLITSYDIGSLGGNDFPYDITFVNDYFYITDANCKVYKYPSDFSSLTNSYNLRTLGNDGTYGIEYYNNYFYVVDLVNLDICKFPSDFSSLTSRINIGSLGGNDNPFGIVFADNHFYVTDSDKYVYRYPSDFNVLEERFSIGALGNNDEPLGLTYSDYYFYVVDHDNSYVFEYPLGTYLLSELNTNTKDLVPDQPSDFSLINGTSNFNGDFNSIDADYTNFTSTPYLEYPATYDFKGETGNTGIGISIIDTDDSAGTTSAEVIAHWINHNEVLRCYDADGVSQYDYKADVSSYIGTEGYFEFYAGSSTNGCRTNIMFQTSIGANTIAIRFDNDGDLKVINGAGWDVIQGYSANQWYHLRIVFRSDSGSAFEGLNTNEYKLSIDGGAYSGTKSFQNNGDIDDIRFNSRLGDGAVYGYYDSVGFTNDPDYKVGMNLNNYSAKVNISINTQLNVFSNETIDNFRLDYAFKSNITGQLVNFSVWDYDHTKWFMLNSSVFNVFVLNSTFLNSSYYDSSYNLKFKIESANVTRFNFSIEVFKFEYNITKTSGEIYAIIERNIGYSILNNYDIGFDEYKKLFNVTINFMYNFTNYTAYNYTAFLNQTILTKDGNWHVCTWNFEWDSSLSDIVRICLNISNGYLEIKNLNYSIYFKCLKLWEYEAGTYPLLSDEMGETDLTDWTETIAGSSYIQIIEELGSHFHVIDCYCDGVDDYQLEYSLSQASGTLEFYFRSDDLDAINTGLSGNGVGDGFALFFGDVFGSGRGIYDGGGVKLTAIDENQWYRVKLTWDCTTDKYQVYYAIGSGSYSQIGTDKNFANNLDTITTIGFGSFAGVFGSNAHHFYLDGIGIVGENSYSEGNNQKIDVYATSIYQTFRFDPNLSLDYLQKRNGNWLLNFTANFSASSNHYYKFFSGLTQFNNSLFAYRIAIQTEDSWLYSYYGTNTTFSATEFSVNLTKIIMDAGKKRFLDYFIDFYILGNPSNMTLFNASLLDWDDYFYNVTSCYLDDSIVVSHQNITLFYSVIERYCSHIEIYQKYKENPFNLILNTTLYNTTLQSFSYYNTNSGFYVLNFTFYDTYANWERWQVNFTIIEPISLCVAYRNPAIVNQNNTVNVNVDSSYSITYIYYHNSTNYILQYDNSSFPIYQYNFSFNVNYSVSTLYNISIKVISQYNDSFYVNITNLHFIRRVPLVDIINLKGKYEQNDIINLTISLRDYLNDPIPNKLVNYTIIHHLTDTTFINSSQITDNLGEFNMIIPTNTSWTGGFYHLNVSFIDNNSQYANCWKMMSFEILPITRVITNSTIANLTVRGSKVGSDNRIKLENIQANSFYLDINNTGTLTFDLLLENVTLVHNTTYSYSESLSLYYTFRSSGSIFSYITFTKANISDIPLNYSFYYFDELESSNYQLTLDNLQINDLLNETYNNLDEFTVHLRYLQSQASLIQLTTTPTTDQDSVDFCQKFYADMDYKFWYFESNYEINEIIEIEHLRTSQKLTDNDVTNENNKYYFDLDEKTEINDVFNVTLDIDPNWDVDYEVITDNGTYAEIQISYSSDLVIDNVIIVLDLSDDNIYAEDWERNSIQSSSNYILRVPNMNFTTSTQTLSLTGTSSVPYAEFEEFENDKSFEITKDDYKDLEIDYFGYLEYYKYSKAWIIDGIDNEWDLDGVHYQDTDLTINNGLFICSGWDNSITSSYLLFETNPIDEIEREQEDDVVKYVIDCNLPCENVDLEFYIESEQRFILGDINIDYLELVELYSEEGKTYYQLLRIDLEDGKNTIKIEFEIQNLAESSVFLIVAGVSLLGFVITYYSIRNKKVVNKLRFWKKKEKKNKKRKESD